MKTRLEIWLRKTMLCLAIGGAIGVVFSLHADNDEQKAVEETRQTLRQQGFKTDLADFNFSTSPELRAREAILTAADATHSQNQFRDHPNLMEVVGSNSVIVVWKQDGLKSEYVELNWTKFHEVLNENQRDLDAACEAALSGQIGFNLNADAGNAMLLRHLATLKNLLQTFGSRIILDLHDGNKDAAWTNLLAETRLVTAWEPEPAEVSHLVRFACATLVYNVTWQALQTNGWSDERLAHLQRQWESVNFFKKLPETSAFRRASDAAMCQRERQEPVLQDDSLAELYKEMFRSPKNALAELDYYRQKADYRQHGSYEDEKALLLFNRDREIELRNAVQVSTWSAMRGLPGVTNKVFFQSKYRSRLQSILNLKELNAAFLHRGTGFLGRAAEAEARRRIIITAIALERYRGKHGLYPKSLAELKSELLKNTPVDFMDGQPLRYHLMDDDHFILYSVGLDGIDNGGEMRQLRRSDLLFRDTGNFVPPLEGDLVWPLPGTSTEVANLRQQELNALKKRADEIENFQASAQWEHTARHQAEVERLLDTTALTNLPDINFHGRPLSEVLRNLESADTNKLSLCEMLTLKQVVTGGEPETITFQVPIAYDVVTNLGELRLYIDPTNNDDSDEGCNVQQMECSRGTNGNCMLVWNTIYESQGKHALQAGLALNELPPDKQDLDGPLLAFTITNLCQFSLASSTYDLERGAQFHVRLSETHGIYTVECVTTNGEHLKTFTGTTTNGVFKVVWDLVDDNGRRLNGERFDSVIHISLPNSGRTQTLRGP